ncbi:MAG: PmoA family protein [Candidatus Hydrogenedentes bacterium]|nr:PmoA family protein [Candidatus Hydrogenedentota bacterium]
MDRIQPGGGVVSAFHGMTYSIVVLAAFGIFADIGQAQAQAQAQDQEVTFQEADGRVQIRIGGAPFATYVYRDEKIPRPYFCNVMAPNGVQVTRPNPPDPILNKGNDDHPEFHPGIWLAFGDIGGTDVWRNKGRVRHERFVTEPRSGTGTFAVENVYETTDSPPRIVCRELCTYAIHATARGCLVIMESDIVCSDRDLTFGDQEEMGLGVRMATSLTVEHGGGSIVNSEGGANEAGTWGRQAAWCSYYGAADRQRVGITIMADPANFRPSWFHTRDYGLMVANPFGKKAMTAPDDAGVPPDVTLVKQGQHLRLSFGILVFSGPESVPFDGSGDYKAFLDLLRSSRGKE